MRVPPARVSFPAEDRAEILARIDEALASGPAHARSDRPRARRGVRRRATQTQHAVAVSSGTSALEIILRALGVEGREVLVPANTFFATAAAAVARRRARACSSTATRETMAFDLDDVDAQIGPDTAAVVAVHIGGLISPAVPALAAAVRASGACTSSRTPRTRTAARSTASRAGTFGVAGAFSFYPTKVIAGGEGGMIVTDDDAIADEAAHLPRPGQGIVPRELPHAARRELAHERAARRDRALAAAAASTSSSRRARRSRSATTPRSSEHRPAARSTSRPTRTATTTSTSRSCPTASTARALKQTLRERFDIGLSGEVYDTPLHQQPVFAHFADRAAAGRRVAVRAAHLPAAVSVARRERRRLRRRVPGTVLAELGRAS